MRKEDTVRLNTHYLVRRLEVLEMKQWLLADLVGVSAKTVNRWIAGKVARIARHNLVRLAAELHCAAEDLTLPDETDVHATREQQRIAARLIQERDLLQLLSPSDNWELAESLIKATMQPNLPLVHLGMLYNVLSIATWRQGHYEEGMAHAERAREIGEKCGDRGIIHKAVFNIATIDSLKGRPLSALEGFEWALRMPEYFASKRDHASALSNISSVYCDFARFNEAIEAQRKCIRMFEELKLPFNLAIAWTSLGMFHAELGLLDDAEHAITMAARYAAEGGYERGESQTLLYRANIASLRECHEEALQLAEDGMRRLQRFEVYDLECHEIAARVARRAGEIDEALLRLEKGLERTRPFPILHAHMLQEAARLSLTMGNDAAEPLRRANEIYAEMGLIPRIRMEPVVEYGEGWLEVSGQ